MNFVRPFFRNNPLTRPATVILSDGTEFEINGIFERDKAVNDFGGTRAQNFNPLFICAAEDIPGADNNARIVVHYGYLLDENGKKILTEASEPIIAENEFTYYVIAVNPDADGFVELELSEHQK